MRSIRILILLLTFASPACQSAVTPLPTAPVLVSDSAALPTSSPTLPASTSTPTAAATGLILVDTLEQEVYPFVQNGKCSLGEAIFSANSGEVKDTCAAGVPNETVIELMPGEYHFTQPDQTPPQDDWIYSTVGVGNALPMVSRSLTIRGNGATLIRDESGEPFRFFEIMFGTFTLENITLQNGDVADDWGGAIYSMNASVNLTGVNFVNNYAEHGGGLYFYLGALNVQNSLFQGNHAIHDGGGLFVDSARMTVQSTRFDGNEVAGEGGGLYLSTVTLVMIDSLLTGNRVNGEGLGSRGGGIYGSHVNLTVTRSQFYGNEAPMYGGAISINNPILAGIDPEAGDPIEQLAQSPFTSSMLTSVPGFQATLEAHPSGVFVEFHEDSQIHNNCFANNITVNPEDPNWTSALLGRASVADGNYWGDPSGPSGMGTGSGDSIGKNIAFLPFLTEVPAHCDPSLAQQE